MKEIRISNFEFRNSKQICEACVKLIERELGETMICLGKLRDRELLRFCIKGNGIWCISELDKDDAKDLATALSGAAGLIS
jgi:recombinational DNA repair protein RecR